MSFTTPKRNLDSMTSTETPPPATGGDGSSIEIAKRPRGRPPGSKNRPKPPVIITQDSPHPSSTMMRPHILEIPANHDLIETLSSFSRRKSLGLCVLAGTGAVSNLTLRQPPHPSAPPSSSDATLGFRGRFEILSLSATVMPPAASVTAAVTVAGPQGQVLGGTVVGPLVTAGTVTVVAAAFENPTWHRLPVADDDVARSLSESGGGDDSSGHHEEAAEEQKHQQRYVHRVGEYEHHRRQQQQAAVDSCGMGMYASPHFQAAAEGIWPPTARPPPY